MLATAEKVNSSLNQTLALNKARAYRYAPERSICCGQGRFPKYTAPKRTAENPSPTKSTKRQAPRIRGAPLASVQKLARRNGELVGLDLGLKSRFTAIADRLFVGPLSVDEKPHRVGVEDIGHQ